MLGTRRSDVMGVGSAPTSADGAIRPTPWRDELEY